MTETIRQADAARILGVSRAAISIYVRDGKLSTIEVDGRRMLLLDEVKALNPKLGWVTVRRAFEDVVKSAIDELKEEKRIFTTGQVFGKVAETLVDSETALARVRHVLRDDMHQGVKRA